MNYKSQGLTVGELTIAVGLVIIVALIWSNLGNKENSKEYWRHTGYPGGQKTISYKRMLETYPDRVINNAVKGMLPHNKLGRKLLKHLKVYRGQDHPHKSQNPESLVIN